MFGLRQTERIFHDVPKGSNLDLILRGFNGAINKLADGLQAIALALRDGSTQTEIDKVAAELDASTTQQQKAIDEIKGE